MTAQTGDFGDVFDFVARLRPYFPDADLSVNAGPAFDAAMMLGLSSIEKIEKALGSDSLQPRQAAAQIQSFNLYLEEAGRGELALNSGSADLILISLLAHDSAEIEGNLVSGPGQGRVSRLYSLARAYRDYVESTAADKDAA